MCHHPTKTFTIVAELEGVTSVAQVGAPSPQAAFEVWAKKDPRLRKKGGKGAFDVKQFVRQAGKAVPVESYSNVWCISGLVADKLLLIHIVLTASSVRRSRAAT